MVYLPAAVASNPAEIMMALLLLLLFGIGPFVYMAFTIRMARHPERYKEKTVRFLLYRYYKRSPSNQSTHRRH